MAKECAERGRNEAESVHLAAALESADQLSVKQRRGESIAGLRAPSLASSRLRLRHWQAADAPSLELACGDPAICRFTTVPRVHSHSGALEWIARQQERLLDGTALVLAMEQRELGVPIGTVWLFDFEAKRSARVGCWLLESWRAQRYGQEAVATLARWAFAVLRLETLYFDFETENESSRGTCRAIGAAPLHAGQRLRGGRLVHAERWVLRAPGAS
jgi:RimJ/RimL family protein N-acetyltransferase